MPGGQSASVVEGLTGSELNTSTLRGEPWTRWGGDQRAAGGAGLTWWPGGGTGRRKMLSIEKGRAFGLGSLSERLGLPRNVLRKFIEGKTEGKRGKEGDEWRGGEAEGEAGAEVVADSGDSHIQVKGEKGGCSSDSSLHSSMAGIASESFMNLIPTL